MRICGALVAVVLLLAMTGCISSTTVIRVKADGSGTIVDSTAMSSETVAMMRGMISGIARDLGNQPEAKSNDPFSEEQARQKAAKLGQGVVFLSSEKIKTSEMEGIKATYTFSDITKVKISEKPATPEMGVSDATATTSDPEIQFRFAKQGANSVLTIVVPQKDIASAASKSREITETQGEPPAEQIAMFTKLLKGLRITRELEVDGTVVNSNATYTSGSRITLVDVEFDELVAGGFKVSELSKITSLEDARKALQTTKGIKLELSPEVRIEFAKP
jgi:hypothetical protein